MTIKFNEFRLRSLVKAITWRISTSSIMFALSMYLNGDVHLATKMALGELIIVFSWYFLHERLWNSAFWGKEIINATD
jgi:uncharacterized membrane protein